MARRGGGDTALASATLERWRTPCAAPKSIFEGVRDLDGFSRRYILALPGLAVPHWRDLLQVARPQDAAEAVWRVHRGLTTKMVMKMLRHLPNMPTGVQGLDQGAEAPCRRVATISVMAFEGAAGALVIRTGPKDTIFREGKG